MFSFDQLSTPITEDEALDMIIQRLSELGFSSKGWQDGSMQLTFCKLGAWGLSGGTRVVQALLYGGLNEKATGDFLTRFSYSSYNNIRQHKVAFQYACELTVASGEGPHSVEAGELIATNGTYFYRNVDDGLVSYPVTLTDAAPTTLTFEAEIPGADAAASDGTITTLVTTLAGVTIDNPDPSLLTAGANEESDEALRTRNRTKWALLSIAMPVDGYINVALSILSNARVAVDDSNPRGPGTVDVYIAGESGEAGASDVTAVDTEIQARRPVTANVETIASSSTTIVVTGTVYLRAPATLADVKAAIKAYVNTLPIGGEQMTPSTNGVPLDGIEAAARSVAGVKNVDLTLPTGDTELGSFDIAIVTDSSLAGLMKTDV